jgi:cardiolipin synthase
VYLLISGRCDEALRVGVVAGLTDAADGLLARRFGWVTRTGAYLDPIADKFLLVSLYVSFGIAGMVPAALVWLVVGRDLLILLMASVGLLFTPIRDFPPSVWGKISTVIQIGAAGVVMAACTDLVPETVRTLALAAVAAGTAWSGIHYLWRGIVMWRNTRRGDSARSAVR